MNSKNQTKAVGLISGGLDSGLAAAIVKNLGVEVYGIHFVLPWNLHATDAKRVADQVGIPLKIFQMSNDFLKVVRSPKYGYGSAINPCIDCKIFQLRHARKYMVEIGADFVFTGEVLGQRPMSQLTHSLKKIEIQSGLEGYLLRPLSAKNMDPTIAEKEGKIDREKLYDFSGRARSGLLELGRKFGITDFIPTGGGCLLTDKNFASRLRDIFKYGYHDANDIISLKWGRHFRFSEKFKAIVGRDDPENIKLIEHAGVDDLIFDLNDKPAPVVILKGENPPEDILFTAAFLVKKFSKFQNMDIDVRCWQKGRERDARFFRPQAIDDARLMAFKI